MTPEEAATVLVYVNQLDPLVPLNDSTSDVWWEAINRFEINQAIWCIKNYYATTKPDWSGKIIPLSPAILRSRISDEQERANAKRRALEPPPKHTNPDSYRSQNPTKFAELMQKGRDDRRADLARQGILLMDWQLANDRKPEPFTT